MVALDEQNDTMLLEKGPEFQVIDAPLLGSEGGELEERGVLQVHALKAGADFRGGSISRDEGVHG